MKIGIVGFSFATRVGRESSPCNVRLAHEVMRLAHREQAVGNEVVIVVQFEIAHVLDRIKFHYDLSAKPSPDDPSYFSSEHVMDQATPFLKERGVKEVIPVANPWLHIIKCQKLVAKDFRLGKRKIHAIGFDELSDQPWCRGPIRLLLYALRQKLFGSKGS